MGKKDSNGKSDVVVSKDFLKNLDAIKEKIKSEHKVAGKDIEGEVVRELVKRKRGRRKSEVRDDIDNVGTDFCKVGLAGNFRKNIDSEDALQLINESNDEERKRIKRRYSQSKLLKYIFKDSFGSNSGVFFDTKSRDYLERILDIQMNYIRAISKSPGLYWKVFGVINNDEYYLRRRVIEVGYVYCVGVSNALVLGRELCDRNSCSLSHIKYVYIGDESNGCKR